MRLPALFSFILAFALASTAGARPAAESVLSRKVTVSFNREPIASAIERACKAAGVDYNTLPLPLSGWVTAPFENAELTDVLASVLAKAEPGLRFREVNGRLRFDLDPIVNFDVKPETIMRVVRQLGTEYGLRIEGGDRIAGLTPGMFVSMPVLRAIDRFLAQARPPLRLRAEAGGYRVVPLLIAQVESGGIPQLVLPGTASTPKWVFTHPQGHNFYTLAGDRLTEFNTYTFAERRVLEGQGGVVQGSLSADGSLLVMVVNDGIRVVDTETMGIADEIKLATSHQGAVSVEVAPNRRSVFVGSSNSWELVDLSTHSVVAKSTDKPWSTHRGVTKAVFDPSGRYLALSGGGQVSVFDLARRASVYMNHGYGMQTSLAFLPGAGASPTLSVLSFGRTVRRDNRIAAHSDVWFSVQVSLSDGRAQRISERLGTSWQATTPLVGPNENGVFTLLTRTHDLRAGRTTLFRLRFESGLISVAEKKPFSSTRAADAESTWALWNRQLRASGVGPRRFASVAPKTKRLEIVDRATSAVVAEFQPLRQTVPQDIQPVFANAGEYGVYIFSGLRAERFYLSKGARDPLYPSLGAAHSTGRISAPRLLDTDGEGRWRYVSYRKKDKGRELVVECVDPKTGRGRKAVYPISSELAGLSGDGRVMASIRRSGGSSVAVTRLDDPTRFDAFGETELGAGSGKTVLSAALNLDGSIVAVGTGQRVVFIDVRSRRAMGFPCDVEKIEFSYGRWIVSSRTGLRIFDGDGRRSIVSVRAEAGAISPDGDTLFAIGTERTFAADLATGKIVGTGFGLKSEAVRRIVVTSDGKAYVLTTSGTLQIWEARKARWLANHSTLSNGSYITRIRDNFYLASRGSARVLRFQASQQTFPFEQFDLRLSRPDLVLAALGDSSEERINELNRAYRLRVKKMGFDIDKLENQNFHAPTVRILSEVPATTQERDLRLVVNAFDGQSTPIDRIQVEVNGVPVPYDPALIFTGSPSALVEKLPIDVELSQGKNKIQVVAFNRDGISSPMETREVQFSNPTNVRPRRLFLLSIGVSKYRDPKFDLQFASKDAGDLAAFFQTGGKRDDRLFEVMPPKVLFDKDVTKESILAQAKYLGEATVDDMVVVFIAGHGLVDRELGYFFATHDVDFRRPAERGLSYEAIDTLMKSTRSRQKLLLMDTCHAGELEPNGASPSGGPDGGRGVEISDEIKRRTVETGGSSSVRRGSLEIMQQMFVDLRRGSGATVIAAARGNQYAAESNGNGRFTRCFLEALAGKANKAGGPIKLSQVMAYVSERVAAESNRTQEPMARQENLEVDYVLATTRGIPGNGKSKATPAKKASDSTKGRSKRRSRSRPVPEPHNLR